MESNKPKPAPQFYRRVLPKSCISFSSSEGKQLFKEALSDGHMECYFKLAAQFRTQDEPAFCGLSTLVMVLNALEVDPGQVWKGPWRWYHENMLECCVPLDVMKENGINFDQYICLALCNSLEAIATRVENSSLQSFREVVKEYSQKEDAFLTLSYSRRVLGQTGDGHFSPIAGYHKDRDMALVMDTARFKYPPHWVPVPLLWEAMKPLDKETGKCRGHVILSKPERAGRILPIFRLSKSFSVSQPSACNSNMASFLEKWIKILQENMFVVFENNLHENEVALETLVSRLLHELDKSTICLDESDCFLTTHLQSKHMENMLDEHREILATILRQLESLELFKVIQLSLRNEGNFPCCVKIGQEKQTCEETGRDEHTAKRARVSNVDVAHFVTVLLLCFPYQTFCGSALGSIGELFSQKVENILTTMDAPELKNEISALQQQLDILLKTFQCHSYKSTNKDKAHACCQKRQISTRT